MSTWNKFLRFVLFIAMLAGIFTPAWVHTPVLAAPLKANPLDVIISEVAWGGTSSSYTSDEWIELYNPTSSSINLSGWTLISSDSTPSINLTGTIHPGGYFLIECTDDFTVFDVAADQIIPTTCSSNLNNSGETLTLSDGVITVDTANISGGGWDAGHTVSGPSYSSMERIGVVADSASAWVANDGITRNGLAADGVTPINGTPHTSKVDASLTMTVNNIIPNVGDTVSFTITVNNINNTGYASASNVKIMDLLPSGLGYQADTPSIGSYDPISGVWDIGNLPVGSNATLIIDANVITSGSKTNFAEVWSSDQIDSDSVAGNSSTTEDDDDSKTVTPPPVGSADLSLTQLVNNTTPLVGENVVFTLTVTNEAGPDDATGVQVKDSLPVGLTYVSDDGLGTYNNVNGIWSAGTVSIGTSKTLKITAKVTSIGAKTNLAEVAQLDQADPDSTPGNNSTTEDDDASTTITPSGGQADLSLSQNASKAVPGVAGNVVFTITVNNTGPYDGTNVEVKDLLPSGWTYVSDNGAGLYNKTTGIWSVGTLVNGTSKILKITAKADASGTRLNSAEIWKADQTDPDSTPGNGSTTEDDDESTTPLIADLSITKTMSNTTPVVGDPVVFEIIVSNSSSYDDATGVQIKDLLPASFTYVSHNSSTETYDKTTGIWDVGTLAGGTTRTLTITTTLNSAAILVNQAEVYQVNEIDPDSVPANNSKTEDDDASAPSADLYVTQLVNNSNPDINGNITFAITVTNAGVGGTTNVQVKDLLPSGLTYVSDTGSGSYNKSTGIWSVGTLVNGASKTLSITAKVTSAGLKTNFAEVWRSDESDPDSIPGNGSTTEDDDASVTITSYRSIIVNEVAWAGTGSSSALKNDQWMELYNPSSASINITGWNLKSASNSINITLSGTISAGGYFLLERDDNSTVSDIAADQIYTGALSTSGEVLTLRDGSGNFIDTANGDGGAWPAGSSSTYGTMERYGTSAENDSMWRTNTGVKKNGKNADNGLIIGTPRNSNSVSPTTTPIVTVTPTLPPVVGRPVINEFLPRPGFDWNQDGSVDVFDEFIEIKNLGPVDVNLNGWKLDDEANQGSNPFTLPSVTLKPGERIVFYGLQTNILLSDGGDTVRLLNSSNKVYDSYTYKIVKAEDKSVCRLPDGNGTWYEDCVPTPSLTNSRQGEVPIMPEMGLESPVCDLPDTLPDAFLIAECKGYGANLWRALYWDVDGWGGDIFIPENMSKWDSFVE
jgi:uncharacterized repeat protein (TIGR01451 family)